MGRPAAKGGNVTVHCKYDDKTLSERLHVRVCKTISDSYSDKLGVEWHSKRAILNPKYDT